MKKFNIGYVHYHLLENFFVCAFFGLWFSAYVLSDSNSLPSNYLLAFSIFFITSYSLSIIYALLFVKCSAYKLDDSQIFCKYGVIFKKSSFLEYSKIHAVNKKQNIFQRIFNIAVLTIDSGSANTGGHAEITIIETSSNVDKIIQIIRQNQQNCYDWHNDNLNMQNTKQENLYKFDSRLKVLYALLNFVVSAVIIVLAFFVLVVICWALVMLLTQIKTIFNYNYLLFGTAIFVGFLLVVCILAFIINLINAMFKYHDFTIYKSDNCLQISYGLMSRSQNTLNLNRIKGIVITQNLIQKMFGFATCRLEVVGYVNRNNNDDDGQNLTQGLLFPLIKISDIDSELAKILPENIPEKRRYIPQRIFPFVSFKLAFSIIPFVVLSFYAFAFLKTLSYKNIISVPNIGNLLFLMAVLCVSIILFAFILTLGSLEKSNAGISVSNDKVTVYTGVLLKKCYVINTRDIIALETLTTPLRRRKNIYSYKIHFYTNSNNNVVRVNKLSGDLINQLTSCVNL